MRKNSYIVIVAATALLTALCIGSCKKEALAANAIKGLKSKLSEYFIYAGELSHLTPTTQFETYELATPLFTDYSYKQRLLYIPPGSKIQSQGNGLPLFPDGTMLVKTFFYYNDERYVNLGRRIIETRVLIKADEEWKAATYIWNREQDEAFILNSGLDVTTNWIDTEGDAKVISYHVPSFKECSSCHKSNTSLIPLGPKLRNLNFNVIRNGQHINQLKYLQSKTLLDDVDPSALLSLANWRSPYDSLEYKARAYLDINCAHCHKEDGLAFDTGLNLEYTSTLEETHILDKRKDIKSRMSSGSMPKLGTTVVDAEGLQLIQAFLNSKP